MKTKRLLIFFIIVVLFLFNFNPVFANSILKKIDVLVNNIDLYVNKEQVLVDNFLYNGTTYVPIRAVAEMNGMDVDWDGENKRVNLYSNDSYNMKTTDGKYNIIYLNPEPLKDGNYLRWGFIDIVFDSNTNKIKDKDSIILIDCKGNRISVKSQPGLTKKNNFLIIPNKELELNTYYSLYIPKDMIVMENGDLYSEEILIYFKTATNVIKGKITSNKSMFGENLTLTDENEIKYETTIVGDKENEFYFTNIPAGRYKVIIGNNSYETILVEENKINNVKLMQK
ncbi:MAG TPA: hypothetical protein DCS12_06175 [Clostridiales bacterium]|jgi:hypothetical protein|nr:hypothetical protein [Clostridiales bacterium]